MAPATLKPPMSIGGASLMSSTNGGGTTPRGGAAAIHFAVHGVESTSPVPANVSFQSTNAAPLKSGAEPQRTPRRSVAAMLPEAEPGVPPRCGKSIYLVQNRKPMVTHEPRSQREMSEAMERICRGEAGHDSKGLVPGVNDPPPHAVRPLHHKPEFAPPSAYDAQMGYGAPKRIEPRVEALDSPRSRASMRTQLLDSPFQRMQYASKAERAASQSVDEEFFASAALSMDGTPSTAAESGDETGRSHAGTAHSIDDLAQRGGRSGTCVSLDDLADVEAEQANEGVLGHAGKEPGPIYPITDALRAARETPLTHEGVPRSGKSIYIAHTTRPLVEKGSRKHPQLSDAMERIFRGEAGHDRDGLVPQAREECSIEIRPVTHTPEIKSGLEGAYPRHGSVHSLQYHNPNERNASYQAPLPGRHSIWPQNRDEAMRNMDDHSPSGSPKSRTRSGTDKKNTGSSKHRTRTGTIPEDEEFGELQGEEELQGESITLDEEGRERHGTAGEGGSFSHQPSSVRERHGTAEEGGVPSSGPDSPRNRARTGTDKSGGVGGSPRSRMRTGTDKSMASQSQRSRMRTATVPEAAGEEEEDRELRGDSISIPGGSNMFPIGGSTEFPIDDHSVGFENGGQHGRLDSSAAELEADEEAQEMTPPPRSGKSIFVAGTSKPVVQASSRTPVKVSEALERISKGEAGHAPKGLVPKVHDPPSLPVRQQAHAAPHSGLEGAYPRHGSVHSLQYGSLAERGGSHQAPKPGRHSVWPEAPPPEFAPPARGVVESPAAVEAQPEKGAARGAERPLGHHAPLAHHMVGRPKTAFSPTSSVRETRGQAVSAMAA